MSPIIFPTRLPTELWWPEVILALRFVDNEHVMERLRTRTKRPMSNQESVARLVSKYRPKVPVFCVTNNATIARQSLIHRGVIPIQVNEFKSVNYLLNLACEAGKASGIVAQGSKVIAIFGEDHESTTLKIVTVE
mmetsp:Transcript_4418/g.18807  ORF Transcript_4418/g.18807 Transcript_4418/m.18807 type:complete len:135 (+) Transcript_4418:990-1394(+)